MITTLDMMQYQAGWLETHDERLDEHSLLTALWDEEAALIAKLIADDLTNPEFLADVLEHGCEGYTSRSVAELWEEMNKRGLTL